VVANTGLTAVYQAVLVAAVLGVTVLLLFFASASVLSRQRHDRPGVLRVLAAADLLFGIALLVCAYLAVAEPIAVVILVAISLALVFAGLKLFRKAASTSSQPEAAETSTDAGFWKQF
jgi:protein-S-isoprenylcysteine O-methyltransferase Ste14